jgi:hypothetical protein
MLPPRRFQLLTVVAPGPTGVTIFLDVVPTLRFVVSRFLGVITTVPFVVLVFLRSQTILFMALRRF